MEKPAKIQMKHLVDEAGHGSVIFSCRDCQGFQQFRKPMSVWLAAARMDTFERQHQLCGPKAELLQVSTAGG